MKYVRYRQMTLTEQNKHAALWGIKSPTQMMFDGEYIFDPDARRKYENLWRLKEVYDEPPTPNFDTVRDGYCCDDHDNDYDEEPCLCNDRNANFECIDCL